MTREEIRAALAGLDSCAVSDALNLLGLEGVVNGPSQIASGRSIVGRAVTVELGPPQAANGSTRHLGTAAIMAAEEGDVIVVAHQGREDCAGWGGNLSRAAKAAGIVGVVVDGAVRDVSEARELDFPIFASGHTPRTARGRAAELNWGCSIKVGGVAVEPGDWLVADATGVVIAPASRIDEIIQVAAEIVRKEAAMAAALEAGVPVDQVMGSSYEKMLQP